MADWPQIGAPPPVLIAPHSECALGTEYGALQTAIPSSVAHGTANLARYYPFVLSEPVVVMKVWWYNGATANGNTDVGVFSEDGKLIISAGATAQGTVNVIQEVDVTDTVLGRGRFYLGLSSSSATATYFSNVLTAQLSKGIGWAQMASAHPLSDATFAAFSAAIQPMFGLACRTLVA